MCASPRGGLDLRGGAHRTAPLCSVARAFWVFYVAMRSARAGCACACPVLRCAHRHQLTVHGWGSRLKSQANQDLEPAQRGLLECEQGGAGVSSH